MHIPILPTFQPNNSSPTGICVTNDWVPTQFLGKNDKIYFSLRSTDPKFEFRCTHPRTSRDHNNALLGHHNVCTTMVHSHSTSKPMEEKMTPSLTIMSTPLNTSIYQGRRWSIIGTFRRQ